MKIARFMPIVALAAPLLSSCSTLAYYEHDQGLLSRLRKPVAVISVGPAGVLLRDCRGHYYTIDGADFATLKPGDILQ